MARLSAIEGPAENEAKRERNKNGEDRLLLYACLGASERLLSLPAKIRHGFVHSRPHALALGFGGTLGRTRGCQSEAAQIPGEGLEIGAELCQFVS